MSTEHRHTEQFSAYAAALKERFSSGILEELQELPQWALWKREIINEQQKKVPYHPNGHHASVNKPQSWATLAETLEALASGTYNGIGFLLTEADPFCFVDIDHAYDRIAKQITTPHALQVVAHLSSYTEASPNDGLHILVQAQLPGKGIHSAIEMYDKGRFLTITTRHLTQTPRTIAHRQKEVEALYEEYKPVTPQRTYESTRVGGSERSAGGSSRTDADVLELALHAPNSASFRELWLGTWQGNMRYFANGKPDESRADWQLIKYLLYWTGNDPGQADRLFRRSALMREKWDDNTNSGGSGHTYGEITIHNAQK